ncbi:MAG: hypothetical protein LRY71_06225 [Bacillaceae bacterium]|nr:hypothetical protein [Bacillaceae bacterium]
MDKVEVIARRVLGWSLNSPKKWYSVEEATFIENFDPTENLNDAMRIVRKFEELGFTFSKQGDTKVCFGNQFIKECGTGATLAEAITNAAYSIAEVESIPEDWL